MKNSAIKINQGEKEAKIFQNNFLGNLKVQRLGDDNSFKGEGFQTESFQGMVKKILSGSLSEESLRAISKKSEEALEKAKKGVKTYKNNLEKSLKKFQKEKEFKLEENGNFAAKAAAFNYYKEYSGLSQVSEKLLKALEENKSFEDEVEMQDDGENEMEKKVKAMRQLAWGMSAEASYEKWLENSSNEGQNPLIILLGNEKYKKEKEKYDLFKNLGTNVVRQQHRYSRSTIKQDELRWKQKIKDLNFSIDGEIYKKVIDEISKKIQQ